MSSPASSSPASGHPENLDDIAEEFEFLDDWRERYGHVIDLGRHLDALEPKDHTPANKVSGCASSVWLRVECAAPGSDRLIVRGASDAQIVQGLVALLTRMYSYRSASEMIAIDAHAFFARIGLDGHLTAQRANGLASMVERIRAAARTHV